MCCDCNLLDSGGSHARDRWFHEPNSQPPVHPDAVLFASATSTTEGQQTPSGGWAISRTSLPVVLPTMTIGEGDKP